MRRALVVMLAAWLWALLAGGAGAGIVESLLLYQNATDDPIQDRSVGFVMDLDSDGNPSVGDVGWGLIRVDRINEQGAGNRVYMVYAAEISGISGSVPGIVTVDHTFVTSGSPWSLKNILSGVTNAADISDRALVALIETSGIPSFSGFTFDGSGAFTENPGGLKSQIQSQFGSGNAQVLAAFGIAANSDDFFQLQGNITSSPPPAKQVFLQFLDFTVLNSFMGAITDWKELFQDSTAHAVIGNATLTQVTAWGGDYVQTRDSGTYYVNYVPEPTSLVGLLGAGVTALALLRRRRKA